MNDERHINILCAGLLFTVICAFVVLKSARDALFLADFSSTLLPYLMAASTLLSTLAAIAYVRLLRFFPLVTAVRISFLAFLAGTIFLWPAISAHWPTGTLILYLWTNLFGTLTSVQAWTLITERMLARQARRSFQIIGSGSILGGTAGGLLARWTTQMGNVPALLPVAAILTLIALLLAQALSKRLPAPPATTASTATSLSKRFVVLLLLFVALTTIVSNFADFQLKIMAQHELKSASGLASFFGTFYAYTGAATFVFQIICLAPLMRVLPLMTVLALLPIALLAGNGFLLFTGTLTAAVGLKAGEQTLHHSSDRSAMELLYMAIPQKEKNRIKSLIDTIGVRTTELLTAGLLILLFSIYKLPISTLAIIAIALSAGAILTTIFLGQEYGKALERSVHREEIRFSEVRSNIFTSEFYNLLPEVMGAASKETVLDLLEILATNRKLNPQLERLLSHEDADIRLKALQIVSTRPEDLAPKVAPLLSDGDRRIRMGAIHYLHSRNSAAAIEAMKGMREDSDPGIQAAIVASDLNDPDESHHVAAYQTLTRMINEYPAEERVEIADVLGYINVSPSSEELLRKLLSDPKLEVQRATLKSIARVTPPGLTANLIEGLDTSPLAAEIRAALSSYGESLIPQLQRMLDDERRSSDKKKFIIRIARSIGGNQALQLFLHTAKSPDLSLRFAALKGMNQLKRSSVLVPNTEAESLLTLEVESLDVELQREQFINPEPEGLMAKVLKQRKEWAQERIFRVLGLIYDSAAVQNAFLAWRSGDPRRADKAAEWLDNTLRPEHRKSVLHFVDRNPRTRIPVRPRARQSILVGYIGAGDQLPAAALIDELTEDELRQQSKDIKQSLKVFKGLTLVEETLNWRFSAMKGLQSSQSLTTIQKLEYLSRLDIFAGLGPQELLLIAYQCTEAVFQPGQVIIQEGGKADVIYLLIEGELERLRADRSLEPMMPGESFGVLAGLSGTEHFFSVRAVTKSLCLQIRPDGFQEILEDYPVMALGIFRVIRHKMQSMLTRIEDLEGQLQQKSD